jgi:hypothetical protein
MLARAEQRPSFQDEEEISESEFYPYQSFNF